MTDVRPADDKHSPEEDEFEDDNLVVPNDPVPTDDDEGGEN
jgi:hypothetical protein